MTSKTETVADLVERLREMVRTDHLRGCEGREYECSCGHIDRQDALMLEAAAALTSLEAERDRLREALQEIAEMTDPDQPDSYRADDREGCLDAVHARAAALTPEPKP